MPPVLCPNYRLSEHELPEQPRYIVGEGLHDVDLMGFVASVMPAQVD